MIRYFWKYRYLNLFFILFGCFFSLYNLTSFKVFFDSERIIELSNVDKDIIEKSIDDSNLLLIGVELEDSLSYQTANSIDRVVNKLSESDYIRSIRSILNERIFISKSVFPIPIKALNLKSDTSYIRSLKNIEQLNSNFITNDLKNLLLVVKLIYYYFLKLISKNK